VGFEVSHLFFNQKGGGRGHAEREPIILSDELARGARRGKLALEKIGNLCRCAFHTRNRVYHGGKYTVYSEVKVTIRILLH